MGTGIRNKDIMNKEPDRQPAKVKREHVIGDISIDADERGSRRSSL